MSASLDHDPRNLYRRISCAAAELRTHGDVVTAFARVVDDLRLAGFERMAEALGEVVTAGREVYDGESEALDDMTEQRDDAIKERDEEITRLEKQVQSYRDAA